jgi:dimethylaniline monooxygenase (N-oxide forming)
MTGGPDVAELARAGVATIVATADAGRRVLVLGNSISGLEIASDLAHDPSIAVVSACRRARWIIQKVAAGVPADQVWFTAFARLLGRTLPPEALAEGLRRSSSRRRATPRPSGG